MVRIPDAERALDTVERSSHRATIAQTFDKFQRALATQRRAILRAMRGGATQSAIDERRGNGLKSGAAAKTEARKARKPVKVI